MSRAPVSISAFVISNPARQIPYERTNIMDNK